MATPTPTKEERQAKEEREALYRQRMVETVKLDPKVPFVLGEKEYVLVFNNLAARKVLTETGINLLTTGVGTDEMAKPDVLGSLIYWGLKTHAPELTQEHVDVTLTLRHLLYYQTQIATALSLFFPDIADLPVAREPEDGKEDENPTLPLVARG